MLESNCRHGAMKAKKEKIFNLRHIQGGEEIWPFPPVQNVSFHAGFSKNFAPPPGNLCSGTCKFCTISNQE